jgi:hypothetical protein
VKAGVLSVLMSIDVMLQRVDAAQWVIEWRDRPTLQGLELQAPHVVEGGPAQKGSDL